MAEALCAQCERAKGRIWCVDEGLKYCSTCSTELHRKKARNHHQLRVVQPPPTCDECEEAVARVECADCGGRGEPLLFCPDCSISLHSRVARSRHVLKPFPQLLANDSGEERRLELGEESHHGEQCHPGASAAGSTPHGIAKRERAEANLWKPLGDIMRNFRSPVKSETLEYGSREEHVPHKVTYGNHFVEVELPSAEAEKTTAGQSCRGTQLKVVKEEVPIFKQSNGSVPKDHSFLGENCQGQEGRQINARVAASGNPCTKDNNLNLDTERSIKNGAADDYYTPRKQPRRREHDESSARVHQAKRQRTGGLQPKPSKSHGKDNEDKMASGFGAGLGAGSLSQDKQPKGLQHKPENKATSADVSKQNKAFWHPNPQEDNSDLSEEEYFTMDDGGGSDTVSSGEEGESGIHRIKRGSVSLEAFVVNADHEEDAEQSNSGDEQGGDAAVGVKDRIKKMLQLGLHPDTPEAEAQQALKNAQRLLTKHNLKQAEVMKGALKDPTALVGGMRVVELRGKGRTKVGRFERWIKSLAWVIADNFDAQHFTRKASKALQVVFYGIAQNADCAGYAFAATFNRITKMSASYTDPESKNRINAASHRSTNTRVARMSYRDGVVEGLRQFVTHSQEQRRAGYTATRSTAGGKAEVSMSEGESDCHNGGENSSSSSGESEGGMSKTVNVEKAKAKLAWQERAAEKRAERSMAICALVVHSQKVGEDFLKGKGIKLKFKSVKRRENLVNVDAYSQGKEDSKQIDINQRGIAASGGKKQRKKPTQ